MKYAEEYPLQLEIPKRFTSLESFKFLLSFIGHLFAYWVISLRKRKRFSINFFAFLNAALKGNQNNNNENVAYIY